MRYTVDLIYNACVGDYGFLTRALFIETKPMQERLSGDRFSVHDPSPPPLTQSSPSTTTWLEAGRGALNGNHDTGSTINVVINIFGGGWCKEGVWN